MNKNILIACLIYFSAISIITAIITCADKYKAEKGKWRIPEKTLMLLGFFGGALAEYLTMKAIRHKTLHKKFMIGLPCFILLHLALIIFVLYMQTT